MLPCEFLVRRTASIIGEEIAVATGEVESGNGVTVWTAELRVFLCVR